MLGFDNPIHLVLTDTAPIAAPRRTSNGNDDDDAA
jgi:hypothetical protein